MKISASTARQLAIMCQGLDDQWKLPDGKEGVALTIERIGYVQIDTIAVIQRAHHHTLWSRRSDYTPQMLHELQSQDRRIFEYWRHAASYLPLCDYRYYLSRMRATAEKDETRQWFEQNSQLVQDVIKRIREEGALGSADFSSERKRGSWWNWKPAKKALEMLFSTGTLMITERRNFHRIYDLKERVLPAGTDTSEPEPSELARFAVRRMLAGLGIVADGDMRWGISKREDIAEAIDELINLGEVTPVEIEELNDKVYYSLTEKLEEATKQSQSQKLLHILSPFDNLVIWRGRLKKLFDFEYKLECYLPAAKRRYGYFCLPILWGEQFVGRLDPKADRKQNTFIVRKIVFESDFNDYDGLLPALAEKLCVFADFNGCERIVVEQAVPGKIKTSLVRELSSHRSKDKN